MSWRIAMARSKREIPHYYLGKQIDVSKPMAWLKSKNLKRPVTERLLYSSLISIFLAHRGRRLGAAHVSFGHETQRSSISNFLPRLRVELDKIGEKHVAYFRLQPRWIHHAHAARREMFGRRISRK
jgi:hypothetical protein